MFKAKFIVPISLFIVFLTITSIVKNKTRLIEKQILNLEAKILIKEKNIHESQLDFHYLSTPEELEKRLSILGFDNYQSISHSKIFFDITEFTNLQLKISNLRNYNEKEAQKK